MSSQPDQPRTCPTCGTSVLQVARYCPNCGTRLETAATFTADDFSDVLSDVLNVPEEGASTGHSPVGQPTQTSLSEQPPIEIPATTSGPAPESTASEPGWTATSSGWSARPGDPGRWSTEAPVTVTVRPSRNRRTMWIILAILGFVIFCCCGSFFSLLLFAENDAAFQNELSHLAVVVAIA